MSIQQKPKVISTFSGCGGSSLGYKLAGFEVLASVERDPHAVEIYKANFPTTKVISEDIKTISAEYLLELTNLNVGELDILDGSPPCQGFSTSGKRQISDERNDLFLEYARLLFGLKPKMFIMENVSGMTKGKMKIKFAEIFRALESCGYRVRAQLLNAKNFGVPQSRERVIFAGIRKDYLPNVDWASASVFPQGSTRIVSVRKALRDCPVDPPPPVLGEKLLLLYPHMKPGSKGEKASAALFKKKGQRFNTVRLHWDRPAFCIAKMFAPRLFGYMHPDEPRTMTISELKRLASFPDDFKFFGPFKEQWARIGNCVPPKFMEAIALNLKNNFLCQEN